MTIRVIPQAGTEAAPTSTQLTRRPLRKALMGAALTAAAVGTMAASASADSASSSTQAHVAVSSGIALTGLTSGFTVDGAPGTTDSAPAAVSFNVETNNVLGYAVTVQSTGATMLGTGVNADTIPISALTVRQTGAGAYQPLSNTAAKTVASKSTRSANGGDNLSSDFQIRVPVVNADTYTATLNYVASTL
jgi:hypothetical protein